MRSRNEDAEILFWVHLVLFTRGVYRCDIGPLGRVASKLYAYSGENPLIFIENVHSCCDLDRRLMYAGKVFNRCVYMQNKNVLIQRQQFVPPLKVTNVKTFHDCGDLENKVKVQRMTCNTKSCHSAS